LNSYYDDNNVSLHIEPLGEIQMDYLGPILQIILIAEVFLVLSNLSALRRELKERKEK